jgi:CheY-like chemotaxis protein
MPNGIDGRALAERLLSQRPGLKVIYTTGYSAERLGTEALQREGVQLLAKPYQTKALLRAVHERLGS